MDASWCMRRSKDLRSGAPDKIRACIHQGWCLVLIEENLIQIAGVIDAGDSFAFRFAIGDALSIKRAFYTI